MFLILYCVVLIRFCNSVGLLNIYCSDTHPFKGDIKSDANHHILVNIVSKICGVKLYSCYKLILEWFKGRVFNHRLQVLYTGNYYIGLSARPFWGYPGMLGRWSARKGSIPSVGLRIIILKKTFNKPRCGKYYI